MSPPTIAPVIEVNPPIMSTGSALRTTRVSANCTPWRAPHNRPATRETKPATPQTICQRVCSRMPIDSAACGSSAMARSEMPMRVLLKKIDSATTRTPAVAAATRSNWLTWMSPNWIGVSTMPRSSSWTLAPIAIWDSPSITNASPRVAMHSVICGWLTRGRSTTRSTAIAIATMIASVISAASQKSIFFSRKVTKVKAAHNTIEPWAKLKTPDALKTSTKPIATSEYITPASRPPTRVSTKKFMMSSMHRAEIGGDEVRIVAHLFRRAVADLAAVVEHHDVMRQSHHDADIVLDQDDGGFQRAVGVQDEAAHLALLVLVHSGHRLVEQQQRRSADQSASKIDALLHAVGEGGDNGVAMPGQFEKRDDAVGATVE